MSTRGAAPGADGPVEERTEVLRQLLALAPLVDRLVARGLARRRLSHPCARLLLALHDDGPVVMRDLAASHGVTPRAITGLVDRLEADGLVRRRPHPSDRRATLVALTPAGRARVRSMRAAARRLADELLDGMAGAEVAAAAGVLQAVRARLEARERTAGRRLRA
jgi:DNA-binding MarR family transcriptional regulator